MDLLPANAGVLSATDWPAVGISWYQAARYCNWLSRKESIPEEELCYEEDAKAEVDFNVVMTGGGEFVEIIVDEVPLRKAMWGVYAPAMEKAMAESAKEPGVASFMLLSDRDDPLPMQQKRVVSQFD